VDQAIAELAARGLRPSLLMIDPGFTSDGIFAPPPTYLQGVVRRWREAGGLYVADEVQVGYGRSGSHLWGFQAHDVTPDFVTLGKPMGNGYPVAAVITRAEIAERFAQETEFFSTFGGNPVACEAGLAVLEVVEGESLLANALAMGARLLAGARDLADRHRLIGDVRSTGLLIGVDLVRDHDTREPAADEAERVLNGMRDRGVLVGTTGLAANVIKIRPPLVIASQEADLLIDTLDAALADTSADESRA
jgi:4-aminobutyrate aminotransferase-like enzyme